MERTKRRSKGIAIAIILIIIAAGMIVSCTQSLFMVKGNKNNVNQKSENNTEVSVDSTNIKTEVK